jgi:hypothetical protein
LGDWFFVGGTEHSSRVDAVLLSELASACVDAALVEDVLHRLEDVLSVWCGCSICILLATHDDFDDLAKFDRW